MFPSPCLVTHPEKGQATMQQLSLHMMPPQGVPSPGTQAAHPIPQHVEIGAAPMAQLPVHGEQGSYPVPAPLGVELRRVHQVWRRSSLAAAVPPLRGLGGRGGKPRGARQSTGRNPGRDVEGRVFAVKRRRSPRTQQDGRSPLGQKKKTSQPIFKTSHPVPKPSPQIIHPPPLGLTSTTEIIPPPPFSA